MVRGDAPVLDGRPLRTCEAEFISVPTAWTGAGNIRFRRGSMPASPEVVLKQVANVPKPGKAMATSAASSRR